LKDKFNLNSQILGETNEKDFINLFGSILRMKNILDTFDEFTANALLTDREFQDYQSRYLNLYDKFRSNRTVGTHAINDDIVFEIELIKQVEVNIDYILMLVALYHKGNCKDKEILVSIQKAVDSSTQLRNRKDLIEQFIKNINTVDDVDSQWKTFVKESYENEISAIIKQENLKDEDTHQFIENSLRDGILRTTGTDIDKILPPISRFSKDADRTTKKEGIIAKLKKLFEKFFGLFS
jgi:type I restriction enzyme R subunit